jgi:hypothetical protein
MWAFVITLRPSSSSASVNFSYFHLISHGGHLGYAIGTKITNLAEDNPVIISIMLQFHQLSSFWQEDFQTQGNLVYHWTLWEFHWKTFLWETTRQIEYFALFECSLDGPKPDLLFWSRSEIARANNVFWLGSYGWGVSEEKIKMWKVNGRRTPSHGKSSHCLWQGELKRVIYIHFIFTVICRMLIIIFSKT